MPNFWKKQLRVGRCHWLAQGYMKDNQGGEVAEPLISDSGLSTVSREQFCSIVLMFTVILFLLFKV